MAYRRHYTQDWGNQESLIEGYGGGQHGLTMTVKQCLQEYYLIPRMLREEHDLDQVNFRRSIKLIRGVLSDFKSDVMIQDLFNFDDNQDVNELMVNQFWELFLQKHYYDSIGYETYDMFLTQLESQLRDKLPVYNKLIREGFNDFWVGYNSESESESTGNSSGTSSQVGEHENNDTATAKSSGTADSHSSFSDTPQTQLRLDGTNPQYATNLNGSDSSNTSDSESQGKSSGTSKNNSLTDSKSHGNNKGVVKGSNSSRVSVAKRWLNSGFNGFMGLDEAIVRDGKLFSQVWDVDLKSDDSHRNHNNGYYQNGFIAPIEWWR